MTTSTKPLQTYPSYVELESIITTQGFHAAQEKVKDMRLFSSTDHTFTFGPNTPYEATITINPDGSLQLGEDTKEICISPNSASATGRRPFRRIWGEIEHAAYQAIKQLIEHTFPDIDGHPYVYEEPTGQRRTSPHNLMVTTSVSARSTTGHGFLKMPQAVGNAALIKFLGKDKVSLTLSLTGPRATLHDFNVVSRNSELFVQANSLNPNAFHIWYRHSRPTFQAAVHLTPDSIVQEAREILAHAAGPLDPTRHDLIWQAATRLNPTAVKNYTENVKNLASLAAMAFNAKANPSYSAIKALTNPYMTPQCLPAPLISAFITTSEAATKDRRKTQKQLVSEFHDIVKLIQQKPPAAAQKTNQTIKRLSNLSPDIMIPWDQLTRMFPMEHAANLYNIIRKPEKRTKPPSPKKPQQSRRARWQDLQHLITGPSRDFILSVLTNSLTLPSEPGASIELRTARQPEPLMKISKGPDGQLICQQNGYHLDSQQLPHPLQPSAVAYMWTTRGLMASTAAPRITKFIADNWDSFRPREGLTPPTNRAVKLLVHHWASVLSQESPHNHQTEDQLSANLLESVSSLIDPEIHRLTDAIFNNVNTRNYNLTIRAKPLLIQLIQTNPGAITWAMNHCPETHNLHHPGQVITETKKSLCQAGLLPSSWKTATKVPAPTMAAIIKSAQNPTNAAYALNQIAFAHAIPSPRVASRIAVMEPLPHTVPVNPNSDTPQARTVQRFITLLCRQSQDILTENPDDTTQRELLEHANQAADYVEYLASTGHELTHTTWKALIKATNRWHRDLDEIPIHHQWQYLLEDQQDQYWEWDSAIVDPVTTREYTVTPLTSEYDLYQESLRMSHCVINYGQPCSSGASRIFSISQHGNHVATSQIAHRNRSWTPIQTKGYRNHPVPDEIIKVMTEIANKYQQALSLPGQGHRPPRLVAVKPHQMPHIPSSHQHQAAPRGPHPPMHIDLHPHETDNLPF